MFLDSMGTIFGQRYEVVAVCYAVKCTVVITDTGSSWGMDVAVPVGEIDGLGTGETRCTRCSPSLTRFEV